MRLTVSSIPEGGIEEHLKFPVTLDEIELEEDVQVSLKALRLGSRVLIDGSAESNAPATCSRCLKEFSLPIKINFTVEYIPHAEFSVLDEHELTRKELDVNFYQNDKIDIGDLIREQILLSIPMKPLCRLNCKGICSGCGKDLNENSCRCTTEEIDPRLELLQKIRESLKDRKISHKSDDV